MVEEIKERIRDVFSQVFDTVDEEDLVFGQEHQEFEEWDSLNHMELVAKLEEEFDITFDVDDVSNSDTVTNVLETVERLVEEK